MTVGCRHTDGGWGTLGFKPLPCPQIDQMCPSQNDLTLLGISHFSLLITDVSTF